MAVLDNSVCGWCWLWSLVAADEALGTGWEEVADDEELDELSVGDVSDETEDEIRCWRWTICGSLLVDAEDRTLTG